MKFNLKLASFTFLLSFSSLVVGTVLECPTYDNYPKTKIWDLFLLLNKEEGTIEAKGLATQDAASSNMFLRAWCSTDKHGNLKSPDICYKEWDKVISFFPTKYLFSFSDKFSVNDASYEISKREPSRYNCSRDAGEGSSYSFILDRRNLEINWEAMEWNYCYIGSKDQKLWDGISTNRLHTSYQRATCKVSDKTWQEISDYLTQEAKKIVENLKEKQAKLVEKEKSKVLL